MKVLKGIVNVYLTICGIFLGVASLVMMVLICKEVLDYLRG